MKLSRSSAYAIGMLLHMQEHPVGQTITASAIAECCSDLPPRFLYRILRRLVEANVLEGVSGPGGGYRLARSPWQIKLWDIVQAVDGPPAITELPEVNGKYAKAFDWLNRFCDDHAHWYTKQLSKVSLAKLAEMK